MDFFNTADSLVIIGKRDKQRIIPITKGLFQEVLFFLKSNKRNKKEFLFLSKQKNCKGHCISRGTINNIVKMAGIKAKIKNPNPRLKFLNPHLLRHTYAHKWKALNMPWDLLSMLLGHDSPTTTANIYGLPNLEEIKNFMNQKNPAQFAPGF